MRNWASLQAWRDVECRSKLVIPIHISSCDFCLERCGNSYSYLNCSLLVIKFCGCLYCFQKSPIFSLAAPLKPTCRTAAPLCTVLCFTVPTVKTVSRLFQSHCSSCLSLCTLALKDRTGIGTNKQFIHSSVAISCVFLLRNSFHAMQTLHEKCFLKKPAGSFLTLVQ